MNDLANRFLLDRRRALVAGSWLVIGAAFLALSMTMWSDIRARTQAQQTAYEQHTGRPSRDNYEATKVGLFMIGAFASGACVGAALGVFTKHQFACSIIGLILAIVCLLVWLNVAKISRPRIHNTSLTVIVAIPSEYHLSVIHQASSGPT
jgi:F0F1-type ATP synthase assembly protein I